MIQVGCKGHAALRVTTENTARAMGSGELPVLATPAVAALVEKTCWQAIAPELELGMTTKNIMSVNVPEYHFSTAGGAAGDIYPYGFAMTSGAVRLRGFGSDRPPGAFWVPRV